MTCTLLIKCRCASKRPSDVAGVQHNPAGSTMRSWWKVLLEFCADNARVAMWAADLSPDHTELAVLHFLLGLVDVSALLAQVESSVITTLNTLNLDQGCPGVAIHLASQIAADYTFCIQPSWLLGSRLLLGGHHAFLLIFLICSECSHHTNP